MVALDDFTVCSSIAYFPLGEFMITSLLNFYPNIKIILAFDKEHHATEKRKKFFSRHKNIKIVKDIYDIMHDKQMDRLCKLVETKYIISVDDDVIFEQNGFMEYVIDVLQKDDYSAIGHHQAQHPNPHFFVLDRLHPFFLVLKTKDFLKYSMTFKRMYELDFFDDDERPAIYNAGYGYRDTAFFIFSDILKYDLKYFDVGDVFDKYMIHLSAVSDWFRRKTAVNLMDYCDGEGIPIVTNDFIDYDQLSEWEISVFNKMTEVSIKLSDYLAKNKKIMYIEQNQGRHF